MPAVLYSASKDEIEPATNCDRAGPRSPSYAAFSGRYVLALLLLSYTSFAGVAGCGEDTVGGGGDGNAVDSSEVPPDEATNGGSADASPEDETPLPVPEPAGDSP